MNNKECENTDKIKNELCSECEIGNNRIRRSNYGSRMSEPRAGHFRTPKKDNGRRIGKNADTSIRHGARKERRGDDSITLLARTTRAE